MAGRVVDPIGFFERRLCAILPLQGLYSGEDEMLKRITNDQPLFQVENFLARDATTRRAGLLLLK